MNYSVEELPTVPAMYERAKELAPPPRPWVGLTDDEIEESTIAAERNYERHMRSTRGQMLDQKDQLDWWIARAAEAKLREKNT